MARTKDRSSDESAAGAPPSPAPQLASSPCLAGERVAFTGTLASMTHQQASELVEQHGGSAAQHVSRQTTLLVIGEEGWPLEPDGHPSVKLRDASRLQEEGLPIRIVSESDWLKLLGLDGRTRDVHSLYTPAMLSQTLGVPIGTIRRWERLGLIRPVKKVFRLPYFDYAEAAGVRRLSSLLNAGISRSQLEASLTKLQSHIPGLDRPLAQLNLLAQDSRLVARDEQGLFEPTTGQRCFDFSDPHLPGAESAAVAETELPIGNWSGSRIAIRQPDASEGARTSDATRTANSNAVATDARTSWTAEQWFDEGCAHLDAQEIEEAVEAFRLALMERPGSADINFHLAEALYRGGRADAALERYYTAAEADHNYLEAWTQIGCLLAARGEFDPALDALNLALSVHDDYPDAHWHAADVLAQLGRTDEAAEHWRRYLEFDSRGPWAEQARHRLEDIATQE